MKMLMTRAATFLAVTAVVAGFLAIAPTAQAATQPDYSPWDMILSKYYDPMKGMDYKALKANDGGTLAKLRQSMAKVDVASLNKKEQLAYWINLYNINVVGIIVDNYPVKSIRAISTDLFKFNVFKKDYVPLGNGKMSLGKIEDEKIREGFKDPRIHFAINCAARSCPPIRTEAFVGERLDAQLDDQARRFLNGPTGVKISKKGDTTIVETTKIMDSFPWFEKDFKAWGGGNLAFIRKYVSADKAKMIDQAGKDVKVTHADYNWDLNDWQR